MYGNQVATMGECKLFINSLVLRKGKSHGYRNRVAVSPANADVALPRMASMDLASLRCDCAPEGPACPAKLPEMIASLPPCLVGMEACCSVALRTTGPEEILGS